VLSPRGVHKGFPNWRSYKEYGGGMVCDWGAHHLDIAQWGLAMDSSGPVEVVPPAGEKATSGCKLVYKNGIYVEHKDGFGVRFVGEDGEVLVNRGKFKVILKGETIASFESKEKSPGTSCEREVALMEKRFLADARIKLYNSKGHIPDFLACVASRQKPISSEIVGGHSAICCHLMNQSYYNHARFTWDPAKFAFTGGTGDPKWLTRDYRRPWTV
jgi:predicted dehydrogenase